MCSSRDESTGSCLTVYLIMAVRKQVLLFAVVAAVLVFSEAFPIATIVKEMVKSFDRHWPLDRAHRER